MKILILGGTRGLGAALANESKQRGWEIIVAGSSVDNYEENGIIYCNCNLADEQSVNKFLRQISSLYPIDHFMWVAASFLEGLFESTSSSDLLRLVDINFRNGLLVSHNVWKSFVGSDVKKSFTVIASTSGIRPRAQESIYVATKFAQVGFTRSLGLENSNPNLKVSLFLPGAMRTDLWKGRIIPTEYTFFDPAKVAAYILDRVVNQKETFYEELVDRMDHLELLETK